ncbi:SDR family NAD(P)-dependent oxidoreductase [Microvirga rosea]|uniref:SDR family NAD(P)-dependent oxidoreductase n=1 Tax=Microvirga rosea TaxID=2715425 RepID=UPI001D09D959|nr:SDR family NAD(P)-dependent oxidoreductase [Microvirga rosea]MCB8820828.1 SDR family oxidoreductase [Microvirga rosea]
MNGIELQGRHALVTGGGRGIGRSIAEVLSGAGASVTVLGRDRAVLESAVRDGAAHGYVVADVTDSNSIQAAFHAATGDRGAVDLVIANAGSAISAPFLKTGPDAFRQMLDVNLLGVTNAAQAALASMVDQGFGRIIAVASTAGLKGYPYVTAYCAAKHAVIGFIRALALETARTGVTVNAVCPGYTDTDLVGESLNRIVEKTGRSREEALKEFVKHNPQGRLVTPREVADAVLWLCGHGASAITGQAIPVAGGEI